MTYHIDLTEHYDRFISAQVGAGRYRDVSDVMHAGLRLLEQQVTEEQEKLSLLKALATEAFDEIDQGRGIEVNGDTQVASMLAGIGRRVAESGGRARS